MKNASRYYGIRPDFSVDDEECANQAYKLALPFLLNNRKNKAIIELINNSYSIEKIAQELFANTIIYHSNIANPIDFSSLLEKQIQVTKDEWQITSEAIDSIVEEIIYNIENFEELKIKPDVVITGGELLTDEIRKKLTDKFNCYVQTHYSCTEAGEVACECSEKHLHINEDWVIVEPVDKDNNPVGYGVRSDKVLITNLSNYIQPFIRYELTDRIIVHNEKCKCGKSSCWLEIEGRTDDILEFENGTLIAPMSFYKILEEIKNESE